LIEVSRALAKRLVGLVKRTLKLKNGLLARQAVRIQQFASGSSNGSCSGLVIETATATHAIRYGRSEPDDIAETCIAPLQAFIDLAASYAISGEFFQNGDQEVTLRVTEKSIRREQGYAIPEIMLSAPDSPASWTELPAKTRMALLSACLIADKEPSGRYALSKIQLRGAQGSMIATDGRQALLQSGFAWPFEEDLLLGNYRELWGWKEFPHGNLQFARTQQHCAFRCGEWEFYLPIEPSQAYPKVEEVIPTAQGAIATVELSRGDAEYLREMLPVLPADELDERPVTIELSSRASVRAASRRDPEGVEIVLQNSTVSGEAFACATLRKYLKQALDLGLTRLEFHGKSNAPAVARGSDSVYCWMLYDEWATVKASSQTEVRLSPLGAGKLRIHSPSREPQHDAADASGRSLPEKIASRPRGSQRELTAGSRTAGGTLVRRRRALAAAS
jgi:hypothetical protein